MNTRPLLRKNFADTRVAISPQDADLLPLKWHADNRGYPKICRVRNGKPRDFFLHRIVLSRIVGRSLTRHDICDHINGDVMDCRRQNLRLTTHSGNQQNRIHTKHGIYRGTCWSKKMGKWQAAVGYMGKQIYLGAFDDRSEASRVAATKRKELGFLSAK